MELDNLAIEQAASSTIAAPAAPAADVPPQLNSTAAAKSGQSVACMTVIYRFLPRTAMLNRCVCVPCVRWYVFLRCACLRWWGNRRFKQDERLCSLRLTPFGQEVTPPCLWPQVQTRMSSPEGCCSSSAWPHSSLDRISFAAAYSSNGYRTATLAHQ